MKNKTCSKLHKIEFSTCTENRELGGIGHLKMNLKWSHKVIEFI